jgi:hypothetical protein
MTFWLYFVNSWPRIPLGLIVPIVLGGTVTFWWREVPEPSKTEPSAIGWSFVLAVFTLIVVPAIAYIALFVVMFGPGALRDDYLGMPWLTAIPALVVGAIVLVRLERWCYGELVGHLRRPRGEK